MNPAQTQVTTDLQPIFFGQQYVQDNQVIGSHFSKVLSLLPIVGAIDAIAFMGEARCQRAIETMIIFYHQNAHCKASPDLPSTMIVLLRLSHIKMTNR